MSYPSDETIRMLRDIRDCAFTIETRAQWVSVDVEIIQNRPDWETMAEDELTKALEHLNTARFRVLSSLKRLKEKPVEPRQETSSAVD